MDISQLQQAVTDRSREHFGRVYEWSPLCLAACMCGAAGKAADGCRRLQSGEEYAPDHEIGRELATAIIYACLVAEHLQIDLSAATREEFNRKSQELGATQRL